MSENSRLYEAKFAIFLPVKNGQGYVASAIRSVLNQKVSDFQLIVLENKSTDETMAIVRSFNDPRISIIEAPDSLGIFENWQRIFDLIKSGQVRSEFMTILGHDDFFYPDFLSVISELIEKYPDASLYQTHFDLIDANGGLIRPCQPVPLKESDKDFFLARCWKQRDSYGTGHVFRPREYVKVGGIPNFPLLMYADHLLILRLAKLSYKVCDGRSSFAYRIHSKSTSSGRNFDFYVAFVNAVYQYFNEIKRNHGELLVNDYDKVVFGHSMMDIMNFFDFPFQSFFLGKKTEKEIACVLTESASLLKRETLVDLTGKNFLYRSLLRLKQKIIGILRLCNIFFSCAQRGSLPFRKK
ncbi:MAG: glycosyltransferase [Candidatus Ozemobacteraceae bacterium]